MRVRDDLKRTEKFKTLLKEYKRESIKSVFIYMLIWFVFCIVGWIGNLIFNDGDLGLIMFFIAFLCGCAFMGLVTLYKLVSGYKVLEIRVTNKKAVEGEDSTVYIVYEGKKKFYVEDENVYNQILGGFDCLVICRGKNIVKIY